MPQPPTISIPSAGTSQTNPPHTTYAITIASPLRTSTIHKRYSDFTTLHAALTTQAGAPPPATLPPKTWLKTTVSSPALTESRRTALQSYLQSIDTASDPRWRTTPAWRAFLSLPDPKPTTQSSPAAGVSSPASATDPTAWLDTQRDAKSTLREAKTALARRDAATSTSAAHDAAADAKRAAVSLRAHLASLDAGLRATRAALGEGEARRRRDGLAALRRDADSLDAALSARASRAAEPAGAEPGDGEAGARAGLLRGSGRRVLGGGAPAAVETERTRALDNGEVVQLQRSVMAEQDAEVGVLSGAVRRMREMGAAIGEELEAQGGMLDLLDADVGRVQGKVDVGRRRVGQIK